MSGNTERIGLGLNIEVIRRRLQSQTVGRRLCLFVEVDSTNAVLSRMSRAGAAEGTVVLAESQTAGVGRLGARWFSPPRVNLYASTLFRPRIAPAEAPAFSFISALAVTDAIRGEGLWGAIKWPNDVLVSRKKVAGTLAECSVRDGQVEFVILGVGVNLNTRYEALRAALGPAAHAATSLREEAGRDIDRNAFAGAFLTALDRWFDVWMTRGAEPVLDAWRDRDILTGRRVEIHNSHAPFDGRVRGVGHDGMLVVEDSRGALHRVSNAEIRLAD